jgi:hypothetical protein
MNSAITAQLGKFAASDLRIARRDGMMSICQTKRGTLTVTHEAGVYTVSALAPGGLSAVVLAIGKPAAVRPVLASLYDVTVEAP